MDSVCAACQRFLTQFLTTKNCLMIRQFAERHNCVDLLGSTDDFAVDNFTVSFSSIMGVFNTMPDSSKYTFA